MKSRKKEKAVKKSEDPYLTTYSRILDTLKVPARAKNARLRELNTEMKRHDLKVEFLSREGMLKLVSLLEALKPPDFEKTKRDISAAVAMADIKRKG